MSKKAKTGHHTAAHHPARRTKNRRGAPAHVRHARTRRSRRTAKTIARSRRLQRAFVASSQLRPMAQQLAQNRTPAAYAGVTHYAETHKVPSYHSAFFVCGQIDDSFVNRRRHMHRNKRIWALSS